MAKVGDSPTGCPPNLWPPNKYLQGMPGLVALAGAGIHRLYFRQRSK